MAMSDAERAKNYRRRKREARLRAVPSLGDVGTGAAPDGGLGPAGTALYSSVLDKYEMDEHELIVLRQAARLTDRLEALHAAMVDAPLVVVNSRGDQVSHPLLGEIRQTSALVARLCAALGLPSGVELDAPGAPERGSKRTHRPYRGFYGGAG